MIGLFGEVRVGWRLTSDPAGGNLGGDLASDRGEVVFASGQSQADLILDVVGDEEPELNEKYIVQLMAPDKVGVEKVGERSEITSSPGRGKSVNQSPTSFRVPTKTHL